MKLCSNFNSRVIFLLGNYLLFINYISGYYISLVVFNDNSVLLFYVGKGNKKNFGKVLN